MDDRSELFGWHADSDTYSNTGADTYSDANSCSDAYPNAGSNPDTDANSRADTYPDSSSNSVGQVSSGFVLRSVGYLLAWL